MATGAFFPSIQPCNVFFDLQLGSLSKIYSGVDENGRLKPLIPMDFEFSIQPDGNTQAVFSLFDADGTEIEPYIWQAKQQGPSGVASGSFRFGYTTPDVSSETIPFDLANYSVNVLDNSFGITVVTTPFLSPLISSNQIQGTFSQIFARISALHGVQVQPSHELGTSFVLERSTTAVNSTALTEMVYAKWQLSRMQILRSAYAKISFET